MRIVRYKMNRLKIVTVCVMIAAAVAVVVASRNRQQLAPPPDVPVAASPAEVRVKAVERKPEPLECEVVDVSTSVAIVCGADSATADRYEARNDALRSIARRRDLPEKDVAALVAYLRSKDNAMRVERVAALKNDVINLLRRQEPPPEGLAETFMDVFSGGEHPPAVLDYCIQHLGAMLDGMDDAMRRRVRETLAKAARRTDRPYAGTALYSLAEDKRSSASQNAELKRLTLALCRNGVDTAARIAAIQLAGERGYREVLPAIRGILSGVRRDAVLDIVCIGSLGLVGDAGDIALLERFAADRRRSPAATAAIKRINDRKGGTHVSSR